MESTNASGLVLVTGGSGFIAVHCIIKLLQQGYNVRATLRSLNREAEVKDMLRVEGVTQFENLSFIETDLSDDKNWDEAVKGCDYVLHVASPTPIIKYTHEDEFINPARDGVLRVLKAARNANLIAEKNKKPSDIYVDLGFEDLSHFSFAFKKLFGVSPNQAKKRQVL